jgi:hypothetical protein
MTQEVIYARQLFRTQLHARWAVFLDALELRWEYVGGDDLTFRVPGMCEGMATLPEQTLSEAQISFFTERSHDETISVFCGPVTLPVFEQTPHGSHFRGSWAYDFGKAIQQAPNITPAQIRAWRLARRSCWQERLTDGSFLVWPVPAREVVFPGEPLPRGTITQMLPDGSTIHVFDPIKAGHKAINSPRLKAAYIAAKTARF